MNKHDKSPGVKNVFLPFDHELTLKQRADRLSSNKLISIVMIVAIVLMTVLVETGVWAWAFPVTK